MRDGLSNITNSVYYWESENGYIHILKITPKAKRFLIRLVFFIVFFNISVFLAMFGDKYNLFDFKPYMLPTSFILGILSFPISGYFLEYHRNITIDTGNKIIRFSPSIWNKQLMYRNFDSFSRIRKHIGGQFQSTVESLVITDKKGKKHTVAKFLMPDKIGFQPILDEIRVIDNR